MENKAAFCKIYTEFYGEPIDNVAQISKTTFSGEELMQFCEFFASQQKPEIAIDQELFNCMMNVYMEHRNLPNPNVAGEFILKQLNELKSRIQPSDLQKEVERLKDALKGLVDGVDAFCKTIPSSMTSEAIYLWQKRSEANEALNK